MIELIKGEKGLGFSIAGGTDYPIDEGDTSVYITAIIPGGAAEKNGHLRVGDKARQFSSFITYQLISKQLLKVNGQPLENVTHEQSVAVLQRTQRNVELTVSRIPISPSAPQTAENSQIAIDIDKAPSIKLSGIKSSSHQVIHSNLSFCCVATEPVRAAPVTVAENPAPQYVAQASQPPASQAAHHQPPPAQAEPASAYAEVLADEILDSSETVEVLISMRS